MHYKNHNGSYDEVDEDVIPGHQPSASLSPSLSDVVEQALPDELFHCQTMNSLPRPKSLKQPRYQEDEEDMERPDLGVYFDEFSHWKPVTHEERIKMCRTYASYLSSLVPPKPPAKKAKGKTFVTKK